MKALRQRLASRGCTPGANRLPDPNGETVIIDVRALSRLLSDDPFEQLASPRAKAWDVVAASKLLQSFESPTSDLREVGIATEC
jgi:hypothetical protein